MNQKHLRDVMLIVPDLSMHAKTAGQIGQTCWPGKPYDRRARLAGAVLRSLHGSGHVHMMPCVGRIVYWATDKGRAMRRRMMEVGRGA